MTVNRPCRTPFSILNQSVVLYKILTVASWPAYRFLKRPVRWSGIPVSLSFPQFVIIRTVEGFSVVNETEVDVFLELPCFLYDPANVSNLISGVSAFFKPRLDVWKFLVHIMLTSRMQDLYYPSWELRWGLTFFSPVIFQICWCIERTILIVSSFSVLNSSAGFHCNH